MQCQGAGKPQSGHSSGCPWPHPVLRGSEPPLPAPQPGTGDVRGSQRSMLPRQWHAGCREAGGAHLCLELPGPVLHRPAQPSLRPCAAQPGRHLLHPQPLQQAGGPGAGWPQPQTTLQP